MSKRIWIALLYIAVVGAVAYVSGIANYLNLEAIRAHAADLRSLVETWPLASTVLFFVGYCLVVALSLPAASLLTLLAGFLFGPVVGALVAVLAATCGASVVFLIARTSLGEGLRRKAGPLYAKAADGMRANAFEYILFLRLVPLFPFFLVNILPALFEVRLRAFAAATLIGILPGTFVYANLGRELGSITQLNDLVSPKLLAAFALLGLFALLPVAYRSWRSRRQR